MAQNTGTFSEKHILLSKEYPGILAGMKSSGFDWYFELDLHEVWNTVDLKKFAVGN